jgi:hypothetical protein
VDYCYLGLKEGREAVMVAMGKSIRTTFPVDFYRTPISQLPIMNGVENYDQFEALFNVSGGYPGTKEYVQYVTTRFDIPLLSGASAVSVPEYAAYFQSGQLKGLLTGITGAAEYEALIGQPGLAITSMDGQTMGHFVIIPVYSIRERSLFPFTSSKGKELKRYGVLLAVRCRLGDHCRAELFVQRQPAL